MGVIYAVGVQAWNDVKGKLNYFAAEWITSWRFPAKKNQGTCKGQWRTYNQSGR